MGVGTDLISFILLGGIKFKKIFYMHKFKIKRKEQKLPQYSTW